MGDKASLIVSTVAGDNMLAEIVGSAEGDEAKTISTADQNTSALTFAREGQSNPSNVAQAKIKPGAVSAGIALRSLVKGGKLASNNDSNDIKSVQLVGADAANKLVGASRSFNN